MIISSVFISLGYGSEDIALPETIMNHVKKETNLQNIYVMDRGLQSTSAMKGFSTDAVTA